MHRPVIYLINSGFVSIVSGAITLIFGHPVVLKLDAYKCPNKWGNQQAHHIAEKFSCCGRVGPRYLFLYCLICAFIGGEKYPDVFTRSMFEVSYEVFEHASSV
jgi:hypothetical protein